jgi:hypothetical protein
MKLRAVLTVAITAACLSFVVSGTASASDAQAGTEIAGNAAPFILYALSCPSAGNCVAGGPYVDHAGNDQAFVVSERNGRWGRAIEVPGTAKLNAGRSADVTTLSCPSAGNCGAGGLYTDRGHNLQAFVVSERKDRWGKAIEIPGSAALSAGRGAEVGSVSCPSAGNCVAGGSYADRADNDQAFLVSERNGRWGRAVEVPGIAVLDAVGGGQVVSVSCPSAGNCAAGGSYGDRRGNLQAFVVSERNGRWGKAIEIPGTAALNAGGADFVASVSCPSAGDCVVGGDYTDRADNDQAFVVSERNGRWGKAIEVPGTAALNIGGDAEVGSVSCPSAGNCVAAGAYTGRAGNSQAFVSTEHNNRWGKAIEVPGTAALGTVSCPSAGNCAAGGSYTDRAGNVEAFVVSERDGRWGKGIEVPGTAAVNTGGSAYVHVVSCPSPGNCAAIGLYADRAGNFRAFVATERKDRWGRATKVPAP